MSLPSQHQGLIEDTNEKILDNVECYDYIDDIYRLVDKAVGEAFVEANAHDLGFDEDDYTIPALKEIVSKINQQLELQSFWKGK
jgi:protein-arginine kinase